MARCKQFFNSFNIFTLSAFNSTAQLFCVFCLLFASTFLLAQEQTTADQYFQDLQSVQELAAKMPEGSLKGFRILSAVVANNNQGYYIRAKISNGESLTLLRGDIVDLSKAGQIALANNYAIILGQNGGLHFFDRNAFHSQALSAKVYLKLGATEDAFADKLLPYGVQNFTLLDPQTSFGKNANGSAYVYQIQLTNGNIEYLTLQDAYNIFQRGALVSSVSRADNYFQSANHIQFLLAKPVESYGQYTKRYVLEVHFKERFIYNKEMIAFTITKTNDFGLLDAKQFFYFDLYFPNAVFDLAAQKRVIESFGFFDRVYLIKDPTDKNRTILRAAVLQSDIDFIEGPPKIEFIDSVIVRISYDQSTNQSSPRFEYTKGQQAAQKIKMLLQTQSKFNQMPYYRSLHTALVQIYTQGNEPIINNSNAALLNALRLFDNAGSYATNDEQLLQVIESKNNALEWIYDLTVTNIRNSLLTQRINFSNALRSLTAIETFIQSPAKKAELAELKGYLSEP